MKKILLFVTAVAVMAAGCQKYDDSMLREQLNSQEQRITALEVAVQALQARDYVKEVTPLTEDGKTVGYKIVFAQSGEITVMNGKDGYNVEVKDDEVIFTIEGGTTFSIPRYADEHFNVPTSIIVISDEFNDVIKKDTIAVKIIVNPSDFPLTAENVTLLAQNNIYTKFDTTYDDEHPDGEETPFDENAHCDYKVVNVLQDEQYEGAYTVGIEVTGEGNFMCDTDAYVLVGGPVHDEKTHYACSNTAFKVHVIPYIEEGLVLDCPQQSFFGMNKTMQPRDSLKAHYATLWSNWYKNVGGVRKVYDRSKIQSIALPEGSVIGSSATVDFSKFQEHGIVAMTPIQDSEFWAEALAARDKEGALSATIEDAALTVTRGPEVKDLPFTYKTFFSIEAKHEYSLSSKELEASGRKYEIDLSADYAAAGNDETFTSRYKMTESRNVGVTGGRFVPQVIDKKILLEFYNVTPTTKPGVVIGVFTKEIASIQNPDGTFTAITDHYSMINHRIELQVSVTE